MDSLEKEIKIIEGYIDSKKITLDRLNQSIFGFYATFFLIFTFLASQRGQLYIQDYKILGYFLVLFTFGIVVFFFKSIKKKAELLRLYKLREILLRK